MRTFIDPRIEKPIINPSLTSPGEPACLELKYLWDTKETVAGKRVRFYPFRARSPLGGTAWGAQVPPLRAMTFPCLGWQVLFFLSISLPFIMLNFYTHSSGFTEETLRFPHGS